MAQTPNTEMNCTILEKNRNGGRDKGIGEKEEEPPNLLRFKRGRIHDFDDSEARRETTRDSGDEGSNRNSRFKRGVELLNLLLVAACYVLATGLLLIAYCLLLVD
ncbi:hypothetical protein E3N88_04778 [Mikania micrantha]|uniref:Uncharacterized protein n=1 Tax=Mikania micrantha TaxID=192012 RepID=A0A5N6PY48_9ASTR|nr:hypothetical protein E3N88_04778 [Mikania micrantha]